MSEMLLDIIRLRRSIRRYRADAVPDSEVMRLLEAARWAPSAHNRQPWRFAVLRSAASRQKLAKAMGERLAADLRGDGVPADVIKQDVERSYQRITGAAVAIVLCLSMADMDQYPDQERQLAERVMAIQSVAMAGQNLLLMASASGLGACWMCAPLFCADMVSDVLGLAPDWEPQALITVGYPAQQRRGTRQALETRMVWR